MNFKVGDRVRIDSERLGLGLEMGKGIITLVSENGARVEVRLDVPQHGVTFCLLDLGHVSHLDPLELLSEV